MMSSSPTPMLLLLPTRLSLYTDRPFGHGTARPHTHAPCSVPTTLLLHTGCPTRPLCTDHTHPPSRAPHSHALCRPLSYFIQTSSHKRIACVCVRHTSDAHARARACACATLYLSISLSLAPTDTHRTCANTRIVCVSYHTRVEHTHKRCERARVCLPSSLSKTRTTRAPTHTHRMRVHHACVCVCVYTNGARARARVCVCVFLPARR